MSSISSLEFRSPKALLTHHPVVGQRCAARPPGKLVLPRACTGCCDDEKKASVTFVR